MAEVKPMCITIEQAAGYLNYPKEFVQSPAVYKMWKDACMVESAFCTLKDGVPISFPSEVAVQELLKIHKQHAVNKAVTIEFVPHESNKYEVYCYRYPLRSETSIIDPDELVLGFGIRSFRLDEDLFGLRNQCREDGVYVYVIRPKDGVKELVSLCGCLFGVSKKMNACVVNLCPNTIWIEETDEAGRRTSVIGMAPKGSHDIDVSRGGVVITVGDSAAKAK